MISRVLLKQSAAVTLIARMKSYERKENYPGTTRKRANLQGLATGSGDANAHEQSRSRCRGGSRSTRGLWRYRPRRQELGSFRCNCSVSARARKRRIASRPIWETGGQIQDAR